MNYASITPAPMPVVNSGDASVTAPNKQAGRMRSKTLHVSGYVDGTWVLEARLTTADPWFTAATIAANGQTTVGDLVGQDMRVRCSVAPSGAAPLVTLGGLDPSLLGRCYPRARAP